MAYDLEFSSAAELKAHYAALIAKRNAVKPIRPTKRGEVRSIPVRPRNFFESSQVEQKPPAAPPPKKRRDGEIKGTALAAILDAVSDASHLPRHVIAGDNRAKHIVHARHVFFYLSRQILGFSFPRIGRICQNRDHSTVKHAIGKMEKNIARFQPMIDASMEILKKRNYFNLASGDNSEIGNKVILSTDENCGKMPS